jgi:hypothetical protein
MRSAYEARRSNVSILQRCVLLPCGHGNRLRFQRAIHGHVRQHHMHRDTRGLDKQGDGNMSARQGLLSGSNARNGQGKPRSNRGRQLAIARQAKSNAQVLRMRQASQPRTKGGAAVSSQYQGRVQVNASRLPGQWSDTYHAPAPDTVYSSEYLASLLTKRAPDVGRVISNRSQTRRYEYSEKLQRCITKTSFHDLTRVMHDGITVKLDGYVEGNRTLMYRGIPKLFDDCVSFEAGPEQPVSRAWDYTWTEHRAMVYAGKSLIDGKAVYELGDCYRIGKRKRVEYHKPEPLPMVANPLVRVVRPAIPDLGNMLQIWKACVLEYGM